jgi:phosphatidate cytidylyltransferase
VSNFVVRAISGAVLVSAILLCFIYGSTSAFYLTAALAVLASKELTGHLKRIKIQGNQWFSFLMTAMVFLSVVSKEPYYPYITVLLYVVIFSWVMLGHSKQPIQQSFIQAFLPVYTALPFALLYSLGNMGDTGTYQGEIPLAMFIFVWVNDTGAYLTGRAMGKSKMFERVSPNKTWEGTIGGVIFAGVAGYVISMYVEAYSPLIWTILGVVAGIMATIGDLIESRFKRQLGIKDSGNIIPGHGGILDRFDSIIIVAPTIWAILNLLKF